MRRIYLLNLFDEFLNEFGGTYDIFNEKSNFPSEDDPNFNREIKESETDTHILREETWTSVDGTQMFKRTFVESKMVQPQKDVKLLKQELQEAIDTENFERAVELRDEIRKIENKKETN